MRAISDSNSAIVNFEVKTMKKKLLLVPLVAALSAGVFASEPSAEKEVATETKQSSLYEKARAKVDQAWAEFKAAWDNEKAKTEAKAEETEAGSEEPMETVEEAQAAAAAHLEVTVPEASEEQLEKLVSEKGEVKENPQ